MKREGYGRKIFKAKMLAYKRIREPCYLDRWYEFMPSFC